MRSKKCFIPRCRNNSENNSAKVFFTVPTDLITRTLWAQAAKIRSPFHMKANWHCCEDHFDVENDIENWMYFKTLGGRLKIKHGVVPHKFIDNSPVTLTTSLTSSAKKRKLANIEAFQTKIFKIDNKPSTSKVVRNLLSTEDPDEVCSLTTSPGTITMSPQTNLLHPSKRLREQQAVQGVIFVMFDSQEQETGGPSFDIKEEITIEETVLDDLIIPKLENEVDPLAEGETDTSQQIVAPYISKENTAVLHVSDESRNTGKKISNDSRVEEKHFLNIIPKLEIFENPNEDITGVEENCNLPNVGNRSLQETILRYNLNDNIQISPSATNNSYSKRRKINDQDHDFLNTIQVKSGTDYVDYAMHIAIRLQNSNQSDRAIAMAKQKIELILCDLETGLFENSFH